MEPMHPLERVGWVMGIILGIVGLLSWIIGNIPIEFKVGFGISAIVVLAFTAVWHRVSKQTMGFLKGLTEGATQRPIFSRIWNFLLGIIFSVMGVGLIFVAVASLLVFFGSPFYPEVQVMAAVTFVAGSVLITHTANLVSVFGKAPTKKKPVDNPAEKVRLENKLDEHCMSIVNRMKRWIYEPSSSGVQIFFRLTAEEALSLGLTSGKGPATLLDQDLEHLKKAPEPWRLYQEGPGRMRMYEEANQEARKLIMSALRTAVQAKLCPLLKDRALDTTLSVYTDEVVQNTDFVVGRQGDQPTLNGYLVDGDQSSANAAANILRSIRNSDEVVKALQSRADERKLVDGNQQDFLSHLKYGIIERAENGNLELLRSGTCNDCKFLKDQLSAL